MTKKIETASPRSFFALSELPETEIVSLLEDVESDSLSLAPEEDPHLALGEVGKEESELFTQIVAALSEGSMTYGQSMLLMAIYAIAVEDRVRTALMS